MMGRAELRMLLVIACLLMGCAAGRPPSSSESLGSETIVLATSLGEIVIEVDVDGAPKTSAYVLGLVDRGELNGTSFFRSAALGERSGEGRIIQGGMLHRWVSAEELPRLATLDLPTLDDFETTAETGNRHVRGAVSLARDLIVTGVVIPDLVLCLGDVPSMDEGGRERPDARGFPVFGRVIEGMEVVEAIAGRETEGRTPVPFLEGQILTTPVVIRSATRAQ